MAYDQVGQERKLQLQKLEELILRKEFKVGQKVRDEANNRMFKVNGYQLKPYYEGPNLVSNVGKVCFRPSPSQHQFHAKTSSMSTLSQSIILLLFLSFAESMPTLECKKSKESPDKGNSAKRKVI
ncbi:hypothetical protein CR513_58890, partial [Mucuna pruriens]